MKLTSVSALLLLVTCLTDHCLGSKLTCPATSKRHQFLDLCSHVMLERAVGARVERRSGNMTHVCRNMTMKPHLAKEPQRFQDVPQRKVLVFSAYYETRRRADGPALRIIACSWQAAYNTIGDLYCHLWYEHYDYAISVGPAIYNVIYPSTLFPEMWCSHFIICQLPRGIVGVPYAVSVGAYRCTPSGNTLMVLNRKRRVVQTNTHALCISPLYNTFPQWKMVIEVFELHKLLGAKEITIYMQTASDKTRKTLISYMLDKTEKVNVIRWPFPSHYVSSVNCQRAALNDCLYRMGYKHRYVSVTDLDEVLVPRVTNTWPELMKLVAKPNIGVYMFQHAYFRRNTSKEDPYLITQSSFWRTDEVTPPEKIRCKSMYRADNAVSIDLHFPYLLMPDASEYLMPPEIGMLHHYRVDPMESFYKHPERYHYIEDRHMEKYKKRLVRAFNARIKAIEEM
ncbi:hypothetical protein LSAT2_030185 [Lamellibrachia satsuma]|nr:hypothetical protein LSAT2_030185 [Lamellibrachia satsuma]